MVKRLSLTTVILACLVGLFDLANNRAAAQPVATRPVKQKVFIPVEDLDVVIQRDKKGVLLPQAEFDKLYSAAKQNEKNSPNNPAILAVSNVEYSAKVSGLRLLISAKIEFIQFDDNWHTLALPVSRLSIEKATLGNQPARLGRHPKTKEMATLLVNQSGKHTLNLELSTELNAVGSDKVAAFSLIPAGSSTLQITLPAGKQLVLDDVQLQRPAAVEQPANFEFPLGGRSQVSLRITEQGTKKSTDPLVFASTGFGLAVAPGEVTWTAATNLQVFGQDLDRFVFSVPKTLEIADIVSTGLESWELADSQQDASRTEIVLSYRQPFQGARQVAFRGVMTTNDDENWTVPTLLLEKVTSHVGRIIVRSPQGVRLRTVAAVGLRQSASANVPVPQGSNIDIRLLPLVTVFDVWQEDFQLSFLTQSKQREVQAAISTILDINSAGLDLQSVSTVESFFAPLFEIQMRMPAEWTISSVKLRGKETPWQTIPQAAGVHEIRIPLNPPLVPGSDAQLLVRAHRDLETWPVESDPVEFNLPEVQLPQSGVVEGTMVVTATNDLDVIPENISGLDPVNLNIPGERLGFRYQDTVYSGRLKLVRKPARVSAHTVSFTRLGRSSLESFLQTKLDIEGGGLKTIQLSLSEATGTDLRFQLISGSARIVEQTAAEPKNGVRLWTLELDRRVFGKVEFFVTVQVPRGETAEFQPPMLNVAAADRQSGEIALEAAGDQRLKITAVDASGLPLTELDPVDLSPVSYRPKERVVAAYRYVRQGYKVSFSEEKFDRLAVPTAVCHTAEISSVIGQSGEIQHRAAFNLVAIGVQNLQVQLPQTAELWATLIDGQPIEVRTSGDAYLIPLPPAGSPEAVRRLELFYRDRVPELTSFGLLEQSPPELAVVTGTGQLQPMEILARDWTIHHPHDLLITKNHGSFEPATQLDRTSFLGRLQQGFGISSPQAFFGQVLALSFVGGIIALLAVGYRRSRNIALTMLAGVLFCGFMIALILPATQSARRSVGKIGGSHMTFSGGTDEVYMYDDAAGSEEAETSEGMPMVAAEQPMFDLGFAAPQSNTAPAQTPKPALKIADEKKDLSLLSRRNAVPAIKSENQRRAQLAQNAAAQPSRLGEDSRKRLFEGRVDRLSKSQDGAKMRLRAGAVAGLDVSGNESLGFEFAQNEQYGKGKGVDGLPDAYYLKDDVQYWSFGKQARLGVLSLALNLEPPAEYLSHHFRFTGSPAADQTVGIAVSYENRQARSNTTCFVLWTVVLLFWFLRNRDRRNRLVLASLFIVVPLSLITIAPVTWYSVLDGLFLGGVVGSLLWCLRTSIDFLSIYCVKACSLCCRICRWKKTSSSALMLFIAVTLVSQTAIAQAQKKPAAQPAAKKAPIQPTLPKPEFSVIIPYETGDDPLSAKRVFLPHATFLKLWNQAYPEKRISQPSPFPFLGAVTGAIYTAKLTDVAAGKPSNLVTVNGRIILYNYRDHAITLTLPLGEVALSSAKLDGKPAPILAGDAKNPAPRIVLEKRGLHLLDLEFDVPVNRTGPAGRFTIPLKPVPAGKLSFTLPGGDLAVQVNGTESSYTRRTAGENNIVEIPIARGGNVSLAWQPAAMGAGMDNIIHVESLTGVSIIDAGIRIKTRFQYRVRQGSLSEVSFSLPKELKVQKVSGDDVGGWQTEEADGQQVFTVFLRRLVTDATQLTVELYFDQQISDQPVKAGLPEFAPRNITRETGQIGLYPGQHFSLRTETVSGLRQIEAKQFPVTTDISPIKQAPQLAFRFISRPYSLPMVISRRQPESTGLAYHAVRIGRRKTTIASRVLYNLYGAPRRHLAVRIPEDFLVLDVNATDISDWYISEDDPRADRVLVVELATPRTGAVELVLNGTTAKTPDDEDASVDVPFPLDASRFNAQAVFWIDGAYSANLTEFFGWRSIDPSAASAEIRSKLSGRPQFAFQSSDEDPDIITLGLSRGVPQLTGDSLSIITLMETAVSYTVGFRWNVTQAAADQFMFTGPAWLAGRLDFQGQGIRSVAEDETETQQARWTITMRDPVRGLLFLTATATFPPAASDVQIPEFQLQSSDPLQDEAAALPLETQRHYLVLVNRSQSQLAALPEGLSAAVQPSDLPIKLPPDIVNQATQIVQLQKGIPVPALGLQRFARQQSAPASVNLADLTSVISRNGSWKMQANYRIKNRNRQFLAVQLPAETRILSVFVKNRPARPVETKREGRTYHLIALPKTSEADLSFEVKLILAGRLPAGPLPYGDRLTGKDLDLPAPKVVSLRDDAEYGIPVAQTRWTVYLPNDLNASFIDDSDRSNVSPQISGQGDYSQETALLNEATELFSMLESKKFSGKMRARAMDNLKQLEVEVHNYESETRGRGTETQKLQQQRQFFQRKLAENTARLNDEEMDESENLSAGEGFDSFRGIVRSQVQGLNDFNGDAIVSQGDRDGDGLTTFSFGLNLQPPGISGKKEASKQKAAAKKPQSGKSSTVNRAKRREQSISNLLRNSATLQRDLGQQPAGQADQQILIGSNGRMRESLDGKSNKMQEPSMQINGPGFGTVNGNFGGIATGGGMGGGGSGGGGFGGGGFGGGLGARFAVPEHAAAELPVWTQSGGLSLQIDLPLDGQKIVFTKVSGNPKLAIAVRPKKSLELGIGLVWTLVWLVIGIGTAVFLGKSGGWDVLKQHAPLVMTVLGIVMFLLLPEAGKVLGFLLFFSGSVWLALRKCKLAVKA